MSFDLVKRSLGLMSGTVLAQVLGVVRAVMIPGILGPAQFGVWNLSGVLVGYGGNSHCGLLLGYNKLSPAVSSAEERSILESSVFWVNLAMGIIASLLIVCFASFWGGQNADGFKMAAFVVLGQVQVTYLTMVYRSNEWFGKLSLMVVFQAIVTTVLVVGLAVVMSERLIGAMVGLGISALITAVVMYWFSRLRVRMVVDRSWIERSFRTGVPLMAIVLIDTLLMSADRWLVAGLFGGNDLGYYSLGVMVCGLMGFVPASMSNVVFPRLIALVAEGNAGSEGKGKEKVSLLFAFPMWLAAVLMLLGGGFVVILAPVAVQFFLPRFMPALPILSVLVMGSYFIGLAVMAGNYAVAVDRYRMLPCIQLAAMAVGLMSSYALVSGGMGLQGAGLGTVVGFMVYGLGYLGVAERAEGRDWGQVFARQGLALLYYLACVAMLCIIVIGGGYLLLGLSIYAVVVIQLFVYLAAVILLYLWLIAGGHARFVRDFCSIRSMG